MLKKKIGFIGTGKMGSALIKGLLKARLVAARNIIAYDRTSQPLSSIAKETKIRKAASNAQVVLNSDIIILCVKPDAMRGILKEIKEYITNRHLVISIAAGIPLSLIESGLKETSHVIRVMPNTPCLIGAGASCFCPGKNATAADSKITSLILNSAGVSFLVDEKLMDAVTGLSGSGPAYVYMVIEALSDGGVRMGLPRNIATVLAAQTVLGAARMVLETKLHPGQLKDMVTSPGGTTIEGLRAIERGGLRAALIEAVGAAAAKSKELSKIL
jgi:pyrroline-5-carboxylate reductase